MKSLAAAAGIAATLPLATPAALAAPPASGQAVVFVSGFDTSSPFTVANPSCAGKEGPEWNDPGGPVTAVRTAGYAVFTAPVLAAGSTPPPPCTAGGPIQRFKRVSAEYSEGASPFRPIRLSRRGTGAIPPGGGPVRVRMTVTTPGGNRLAAVSTLSR